MSAPFDPTNGSFWSPESFQDGHFVRWDARRRLLFGSDFDQPRERRLADAPTIVWNLRASPVAVVTLGGARTLADPLHMRAGSTHLLRVLQDGVGGRTLAFGAAFLWPGGVAPVLSTAPGTVDVLTFYCDGSGLLGVAQKAFS